MKPLCHLFWIASGIAFCCLATTSTTRAQIVPDATLPQNSSVTTQGNTNILTGGTAAGGNLFHSFEQFSIPTRSIAYFNNALEIQNIISRVTGSSISNIDGLIRANGTANLFLLNPNGIIFGPNAALDIGGSFVGTTASSLNFADGTSFSATAPQTTALLTVSVPLGLQFGETARSVLNQSQVTNSSGEFVGLQVQPGKTLALVGGDVSWDGSNLQAPGGRVELGGVAGAGTVGLNIDGNNLSLSFPNEVARADISLTDRAFLNVSGGDRGSIAINAKNISVSEGSVLLAGIDPDLEVFFGQAGHITLNATGSIALTNNARLSARTAGLGNVGMISLQANDAVALVDSIIISDVYPQAAGNGGDISIQARSLSVTNGAQLIASTFGQGNAGNVSIQVSDTVSFDGVGSDGFSSGAFSAVESGAVGNGGSINITTGSLALTNGAALSASTRGQGNGGNITLNANTLEAINGGQVLTTSRSSGSAGNITLDVTQSVTLAGSDHTYSDRLATFSEEVVSEAGPLFGLFADTSENSTGQGGDLRITTGQLSVRDGAEVNVSSQGSGNAGNLEVTARSIRLNNRAALIAESASGEGGNIRLQTQDLQLRLNSQISTSAGIASGAGNGGNIVINADTLAVLENSDITANAYEGNGGNINITTQGIFGTQFREDETPQSDITAGSELGVEGVVEINTPDIDPSRGLVNLPAQPAATEVTQGCQAGGGQNKSEFVVTGRGGLPPSPNEALSSDAVLVGLVTAAQRAEISPSPPKSTNPTAPVADTIVEAQGWVIGPKGEVVLTATAPTKRIVQGLPSTEQLVQQGKTLYEAERFFESARVWQQAAAAFKATGDELMQAMTLSNLSLAYQQLGQWSQATEAITESLKLLQTERNIGTSKERMRKAHAYETQILAQTLDIQGHLQLAQGQAYSALTTWLKAVNTYAQVGDKTGVTRSRINSAQALQALGLYRQAQKTLTESTQLLQNKPDSALKATGLRSLGNVLRVVGDLEKSRQVLEQSLSIATRMRKAHATSRSQSPQAISDALLSLGNTARAQQDTQVAINFYQQAATASASHETRIQAQLNQLSLLLDTEQLNAAKELWPQIQSQIANLPPSRTAVYARINFAQGLTRLRQHTTTDTPSWQDIAQLLTTAVQQAKNLGDQRATSYSLGNLGELYYQTQQWSKAQDLTQQALFIAQAIDAPDIAYRWQWQLGRLLKDRGNIQGAMAAYTEAVNNIKSLRSDLVAINPEVQFDFRDEVEPVYRQLVDLLLRTEGTSDPSQENLQKARQIIEDLQLAELENFLQCSLQDTNRVEVDRIVNQDNQTGAVIYPIILEDRLEVILKLPQQPLRHYTTIVPQSKVEETLEQLRYNLQLPYTFREVSSLSQRVYDWLIRPVEADLAQNGVETLVFVLDGSLRNIPMAVLYDGKHYLVEKYGVALTPSLQLLDPKRLERTQLKALTAGLTPAREVLGQYFPPLPSVERELDLIKSEVPSVTLLNQEFTSTALQKQIDNSPFSVVHLATHGQFSSNPDRTFILTWDKLINVNELDNLLQSRDQSRPDPIELLVLSACETADGDKRAALGLAGIAVRAGARSTLGSLWAVEDASVADFMGQFYQVLANPTVTKAEALRRAQLVLLQQLQYRHPFYWAPYVLLGNWL